MRTSFRPLPPFCSFFAFLFSFSNRFLRCWCVFFLFLFPFSFTLPPLLQLCCVLSFRCVFVPGDGCVVYCIINEPIIRILWVKTPNPRNKHSKCVQAHHARTKQHTKRKTKRLNVCSDNIAALVVVVVVVAVVFVLNAKHKAKCLNVQ